MKKARESLGPELGDLIRLRDRSMRRVIHDRNSQMQESAPSSTRSKAQKQP